ncbi:MAG: phage/plasmid primase, P4 family, partial [Candidatus Marinimicrobia bacterium]|nr:phage/plasmid primase, P4 family [Candidatus Neomarinimicrobiota bacterium]
GSKGYHVAIPISMFGEVKPSVDLPKYFKTIVTSEWSDWDFDIKIYDKNRLWRCENTINSKSTLYKIRIPDILSLSTDEILELAKSPGPETDYSEMADYMPVSELEQSYTVAVQAINVPNKRTSVSSRPDWRTLLAQPVQKGNRNNTAFDIARSMKYDKRDDTNVYDTLVQWNNKNNDPLGLDELDSIVNSAFKDAELVPLGDTDVEDPTHPTTDAGNAEQFAELYANKIRFNHTKKKWFIYGGHFWKKDTKEEVFQLSKKAARIRQRLAVELPTPEQRKKEFNWGISSESATRIRNTLALAKSMPQITTENKDWGQNKMLLQFDNGTLDLSTQDFRDGRPEDMIYQSVGYDYNSFAKCPVWEKAISEIFGSSDEMVSFFQRTLGYSLTGDTREHCLFILNGNGSNGKSVVLETIKKVLGMYAENSSFSAFEATNSSQSNDIARLRHARLVTASESGQSKRLNEERIKSITGGDEVTARKLYEEFETWTPQFKIWFAVNTLPEIKGTDDGIWRRIKVIPFNVSFKGREDKDLTQKLADEIPGILNWAVDGLKAWLGAG